MAGKRKRLHVAPVERHEGILVAHYKGRGDHPQTLHIGFFGPNASGWQPYNLQELGELILFLRRARRDLAKDIKERAAP
jgi:hypothetical protein